MNRDLFANTDDRLLPFNLPKEKGYSSQWSDALSGFQVCIPNGELFYSENFFNNKISNRSVEYFQENKTNDWKKINWSNLSEDEFSSIEFKNINWKHDSIKMFGKVHPLPRYTSWYGNKDKSYTYSGIKSYPNQWNKGLLYIKQEVEKITNNSFNSVLLNWYRDGQDNLSWHADDEKELGVNPLIASVNFGETRDFIIRRNCNKSEKVTIQLKHGTLLVMGGEMQHYWQHSVPKRKAVDKSRFNLTFRVIKDQT